MALCHNCDTTRIEYIGNGSQTDYTFPFEYNTKSDVGVAFFDEESMVWSPVATGWDFKNDTTIEFEVSPEANQKLIIYRCTDLAPLPAEFFPGSTIKAQDLNDNFFVIQSAIEEVRCESKRQDDLNNEKYWNKTETDTQYSTVRWACSDETIPTTKAVCEYVDEAYYTRAVTKPDQRAGRWQTDSELNTDEYRASAAAITERLDPYFQSTLPQQPPYQIPGKAWFDNGEIRYRVWDEVAGVWIDATQAGRRGQRGPVGPTKTIVSESAPARRDDNTPLENGDFWFDSSSAQIYVYYDDGNPNNSRGVQWVQAVSVGLQGPEGPQGPQGSGNYSFSTPLEETAGAVKFDLTLLPLFV